MIFINHVYGGKSSDILVLQLIDYTGDTPVCTNFTTILDLECVCGVQCYLPILCELCSDIVAS